MKYAEVQNCIGGAFVSPDAPLLDVHDPSSGRLISRVPLSSRREVDALAASLAPPDPPGLGAGDPAPPDGGLMTARATLVHRGRSMAVATAEITNEDGKRIALASSSTMLLPGRPWSDLASVGERDLPAPG